MNISFELRHMLARVRKRTPSILRLNNFSTLQRIVNEPISLSRFGDGELRYCLKKKSLEFQQWVPDLSCRLERALLRPTQNLLQCFNHAFEGSDTVRWVIPLQRSDKEYIRVESLLREGDIGVLRRDRQRKLYIECWRIIESQTQVLTYGEATVFFLGLYLDEYASGRIEEVKCLFRQMFYRKRILFVCPSTPLMGESFVRLEPQMRRFGLISAQFIEAPSVNAFGVMERVTEQICRSRGFDEIFIQAGPVASVLAAELTEKLNVRILDVGSLNTAIPYL